MFPVGKTHGILKFGNLQGKTRGIFMPSFQIYSIRGGWGLRY